jgi:hypothetical protein
MILFRRMIKILAKNTKAVTSVLIYVYFRTNGSYEERNNAMLEDARAFGISSTIVGVVQFVIGASSIAVLNFSAQKQVTKTRRYFAKFFRQIYNMHTFFVVQINFEAVCTSCFR